MVLSPALSELLGETQVRSPFSLDMFHDFTRHLYLPLFKLMYRPALTPADCQEDLGIRQGTRPAGSQRQASNSLRRCHARRLQAGPRTHVHHEQNLKPKPVRRGRGVVSRNNFLRRLASIGNHLDTRASRTFLSPQSSNLLERSLSHMH